MSILFTCIDYLYCNSRNICAYDSVGEIWWLNKFSSSKISRICFTDKYQALIDFSVWASSFTPTPVPYQVTPTCRLLSILAWVWNSLRYSTPTSNGVHHRAKFSDHRFPECFFGSWAVILCPVSQFREWGFFTDCSSNLFRPLILSWG